jgi:hypothetical protein
MTTRKSPASLAEITTCREGGRGNGRRTADECDLAAHPHIGEAVMAIDPAGRAGVIAHIGIPGAGHLLIGAWHIGVMVARHDGDVMRVASLREPFRHRLDFQGGGEIHEISGDRQMVGLARFDVFHQARQRAWKKMAHTIPVPIDETGDPLGGEFAQGELRQRAKVNVGNMREFEHHHRLAHIRDKGNHLNGLSYSAVRLFRRTKVAVAL